MAYQMEKMLTEQGEKVTGSDRSDIEPAITALREAAKGDDAEAIKRAMNNLEQASHKVAQQMYETSGAQPGGPQPGGPEVPAGEPGPADGGDDVIDAEYEVKE
jgi:molecular chaperone DnaK